jgi:hypothetical protein
VASESVSVPTITSPLDAGDVQSSKAPHSQAKPPSASAQTGAQSAAGSQQEQKAQADRTKARFFGAPPKDPSAKLAFCRQRTAAQLDSIESAPNSDSSEIQKKGGVDAVRQELMDACMRQPPAGGTADK